MHEKRNLSELYFETVSALTHSDVSYFHLNSIKNFICSLEKISSEQLQSEIEDDIENYLIVVRQMIGSAKMPIEDRVVFFNKYIYPIGKIYEQQLGFSIRIKPWIFLGWVFPGNLLIFLMGNIWWLYILFNLIVSVVYLDSILRQTKGCVYGFDY